MNEHEITTLADGLTVVSERLDHVRSVAVGWFVDAGSADEHERHAGAAHMLEHMLFRGTESYGSSEIDERFDALGGEVNAATSKESTTVYARVLDEHLDEAFSIGSELVWKPRIESGDLEQEREIVLEELAMYEDEPSERIFDLLADAVFGDHPYGRPVVGHRETVAALGAPDLKSFHDLHYRRGEGVVVAAAGAIDHDRLVALVAGALPQARGHNDLEPVPMPASPVPRSTERAITKPTEQTHLALGGLAIPRDDERRFALRVLDTVLGGCSSSRLFQQIRERRGLAYNVYSFVSLLEDTGEIGLYAGTRPENVGKVLAVVDEELARIREEPVPAAELERARESVKGRTVLALESTGARMSRLGGTLLAGMPLLSLDEIIERIDAVGAGEVQALAGELLDPSRLSLAAIGPEPVTRG